MKALPHLCLLTVLASALPAQAIPITNTVIVDGNEWAQVSDFVNLSWNDINAVCPTGVCGGGTLNGFDMGGWTWASMPEVAMLFSAYIDAVGGSNPEADSAWAPNFLADFTPVDAGLGSLMAIGAGGYTRERTPGLGYLGVAVLVDFPSTCPGCEDVASTFIASTGPDVISIVRGGWFTRTAPLGSVPIPGTLLLLGFGLVGIRWSQKRAV